MSPGSGLSPEPELSENHRKHGHQSSFSEISQSVINFNEDYHSITWKRNASAASQSGLLRYRWSGLSRDCPNWGYQSITSTRINKVSAEKESSKFLLKLDYCTRVTKLGINQGHHTITRTKIIRASTEAAPAEHHLNLDRQSITWTRTVKASPEPRLLKCRLKQGC